MSGIANIRNAFAQAIGDKLTCVHARMRYGEAERQILEFDVSAPGGRSTTITGICEPMGDLKAAAIATAQDAIKWAEKDDET